MGYDEPHKRHLLRFRDWRAYAQVAVSGGEQLERVWNVLYRCALEDDRPQDRALFLAYVLGKPRTRAVSTEHIEGIDIAELTDVDACLAAAQQVLDLQRSGVLDAEEAEAVRRTIELALRAIQAKQGAAAMEDLVSQGAGPLFLDASMTPEEQGEYVRQQAEMREDESDGE